MGYLRERKSKWLPYFGNQWRFRDFAAEAIKGLRGDLRPCATTVVETNAGSHAISYYLNHLGYNTVASDISFYSQVVGLALYRDSAQSLLCPPPNRGVMQKVFGCKVAELADHFASTFRTPEQIASLGAAMIDCFGYEVDLKSGELSAEDFRRSIQNWLKWFQEKQRSYNSGGKHLIYRADLEDIISTKLGDILYIDFAWPWKDGRSTEEYEVMIDRVSSCLLQKDLEMKMWGKEVILDRVQAVLTTALRSYKFVILSNQSSNYPTPEVLEPKLAEWGLPMIAARRLTMPAEEVDNRGLDPWFTEYQYIFQGSPSDVDT